jgi:hypothetical protein
MALVLVSLPTPRAHAGSLDIVVQSTTALPGTSGQFDIDLVNNSSSAVTIAAFSVDVLLSDTTFTTFTAIDNGTTARYIFSITGSLPPGFGSNLLPMEAAGFDVAATAGQVVNPGETWGLAHVTYLVDAAAPPGTVVNATLQPTPVFLPSGGTSLSDPNGNAIAFNMVNGTITVVPEPASLGMLGIAGVAVIAGARAARRSRRAA